MAKEKRPVRKPNIIEALIPIVVMAALMIYDYASGFGYTDAHLPLLVSICVACIVGGFCGHDFQDMMVGIVARLSATLEALLILCTVGLLVSSFMMAGTIPALVYYGLDLMTPKMFLPVGCILCAIVGLACGSSWTTTATMGIAMMGVGTGLGVPAPITAGMIISGAYVGDKFSPLSDTTNLAAAVAETGLFDHVTAMVSTTLPTMIIALVIYTILGLGFHGTYDPTVAEGIQQEFAVHFNITPLALIPLVVVIIVCILRTPGLVGIMIAVAVAVVFGIILQPQAYMEALGSGPSLVAVMDILHYGFGFENVANETVAGILGKAGGMDGTMWTINLVILAVAYGGALERAGVVEALFGNLKKKLNSVGSLVLATLITAVFCDAALGDQFLGISVPAPLYVDKFDELGLQRNMLSRSLEDAGTLWSPMFPWTACGAYQSQILGMSPFMYFPYAFVNLLNPIFAAITAFLGKNIFWADGSYTNLLGKTKMKKPALCRDEEAHKTALANLERRREEGKAPKLSV
ncbi:MAG: Na+/H+ antiporter NhaC family protein [Eubacteriales bacterium]|nr:Na+/H+ antiporter NhaC family protein [Eubacteriales bacterium]